MFKELVQSAIDRSVANFQCVFDQALHKRIFNNYPIRKRFKHSSIIEPDKAVVGSKCHQMRFDWIHSNALELRRVAKIHQHLAFAGALVCLTHIVLPKIYWVGNWVGKVVLNYITIPSSPADQNRRGWSGAVARRLTRPPWQLQLMWGVLETPARFSE